MFGAIGGVAAILAIIGGSIGMSGAGCCGSESSRLVHTKNLANSTVVFTLLGILGSVAVHLVD